MALTKFPYWGGISGKMGPVVAYVRNDKQIVRIHTIPRDPKTPAQLAQRAKLSLVNKGLSPLSKLIKQGHGGDPGAYRKLVGKAIRECVIGEYPNLSINYSKIQVSEGKLLLPNNFEATFHPSSRQVLFQWGTEPSDASKWNNANDALEVVFLDADTLTMQRANTFVKRAAGSATVELPEGWQPSQAHCWIFFLSNDLQDRSNSLYVDF